MTAAIDTLVRQYESKTLTRRQLVASLTAMVGATAAPARAAQPRQKSLPSRR